MGEIIKADDNKNALEKTTENLLEEVNNKGINNTTFEIPIAELSTLGAGVASLIPEFHTTTQTMTVAADGLYRVANAQTGDVLKAAKTGDFWGALKTADGSSKLARLQVAGPMEATTKTVAAFDPTTMMMAAALYSIEKEIKNLEATQKEIISFLEAEKEAEIENDIEVLLNHTKNYKLSWDNPQFISTNHNQVASIKRTAGKNTKMFQKRISEDLAKNQLIVARANVQQIYTSLEKKFKYYKLSVYTYSFASFVEIMLGGNFSEEYIENIKQEIVKAENEYRNLFDKSSKYLEKLGSATIESNVLKGVGNVGKLVGDFIGNVPIIKDGPVDEFLQDGGKLLEKNASEIQMETVHEFAALSNPETGMFVNKMQDMIQIYNHTKEIAFDKEKIYLVG